MSEQVEFLTRLLSRQLGRELTTSEISELSEDMTRYQASRLADSWSSKPAQKASPKKRAQKKTDANMSVDEIVKVVVDEHEGKSD